MATERPPLIEAEVLPPDGPGDGAPPPRVADGRPGRASDGPYHPAAAALLVVVDNLWMIPEFAVVDWPITIPLCFLSVFFSTFLIQRRLAGNRWSVAMAKAVFFAVVAAVPFSVTGTPVGLAFLAWAGVRRLRG